MFPVCIQEHCIWRDPLAVLWNVQTTNKANQQVLNTCTDGYACWWNYCLTKLNFVLIWQWHRLHWWLTYSSLRARHYSGAEASLMKTQYYHLNLLCTITDASCSLSVLHSQFVLVDWLAAWSLLEVHRYLGAFHFRYYILSHGEWFCFSFHWPLSLTTLIVEPGFLEWVFEVSQTCA